MVPIGVTHISLLLHQIQSREREEKEQTNKRLGLTQVQKESYVTLCMCRLTLVWTLAKLPQSYWNADSIFFHWSGPSLMPTRLSAVPCRLPLSVLRRQPQLLSPFVSLSDWRPLTTSGHVEIAGPKPSVWFRAKTDKGIVCLADHLHSVTFSITRKRSTLYVSAKCHSRYDSFPAVVNEQPSWRLDESCLTYTYL